MDIPFTANFRQNKTTVGAATGTLDDSDIQNEANNIVNYFKTSSIAQAAVGVQSWSAIDVIANGQTYTFNN